MSSLISTLPNDSGNLPDSFYDHDETFITISDIIHKISLYITSSQLKRQKQDNDATNKYLKLSSDNTGLGFGVLGLSKKDYDDIDKIIPNSLPGGNTPAKALLLDQLNLLAQNTKSIFEPNSDKDSTQNGSTLTSSTNVNSSKSSSSDLFNSLKSSTPPLSNSVQSAKSTPSTPSSKTASDAPSFQKTLAKLNISPSFANADASSASLDATSSSSEDAHSACHSKSLLAALLSKVQFQHNEIEMQRATVLALENDLASARSTITAITNSIQPNQRRLIDTDLLERELTKSQKANRAFQKALREIGEVVIAVAQGDLSKKVIVHNQEMDPEIVKFKETINTMMDQLQRFASEVTRVATEVAGGTLGGQAEGEGTVGVWRELTDNVNIMASNLTNQVREIADVTRAVAQGDLSKQINVHAQGEILELQDTINSMVLQLRTFAFEVTRVARETGVEGMLGGQAQIDGVEGIWRELTDNGK